MGTVWDQKKRFAVSPLRGNGHYEREEPRTNPRRLPVRREFFFLLAGERAKDLKESEFSRAFMPLFRFLRLFAHLA